MNPYWGKDFFDFFAVLFSRIGKGLFFQSPVSDEVQLVTLVGISFCCALLGSFLNLKKMTMLANSLSHTILLGIVLAYMITASFSSEFVIDLKILFLASLISGVLTTFLTQIFTQVVKLQEDASIGLVFSTLFALGVVFVTIFTKNAHIGIEAVMGNVDALDVQDLKLVGWITLIDVAILFLFFKEFKVSAFDATFASSMGISTNIFNHFLMFLTAITCIGAFRAVGVLLVLAFLVGPVLIARIWTSRLSVLIALSVLMGIFISVFGVAFSRHCLSVYHLPLSTGGLVVTFMGVVYVVSIFYALGRKRRGRIRDFTAEEGKI